MGRVFYQESGILRGLPIKKDKVQWEDIWDGIRMDRDRKISQEEVSSGDYMLVELSEMAQEETDKFYEYIQWISSVFPHGQVILVRISCPDRCFRGSFVARFSFRGKKELKERLRTCEEIFLEKLQPVVIDLREHFYFDTGNKKYGRVFSYEAAFFKEGALALEEVLEGNYSEEISRRRIRRVVLERYIRYYDTAYDRGEQYLLLHKNSFLNRIIRAMGREQVENNIDTFCQLTDSKAEDGETLLTEAGEMLSGELASFIRLYQDFQNGRYEECEERLQPYWGSRSGLELEALTMLRQYYQKQGLLSPEMMFREDGQKLYHIMILAEKKEYGAACCEVYDLVQKSGGKKPGILKRRKTRDGFLDALAGYQKEFAPMPIDVWGNFALSLVIARQGRKYRIGSFVGNICCIDREKVCEGEKNLQKSSGKWLLFDIFQILDVYGDKELTEEDICRRLDACMESFITRYGKNHIILFKWRMQYSYVDRIGEVKEFDRLDIRKKRGRFLEKYQNYLEKKYAFAVITFGRKFVLREDSSVLTEGINYETAFFKRAYKKMDVLIQKSMTKKQREKNKLVVTNYVSAYPNGNLGDDLFLHMLSERYPQENFTLFVKNPYLKEIYSRYPNFSVHVCDQVTAIEKCKRHIMIGGSMFIENGVWKIKCQNLQYLKKAARKNYMLGVNFGPYFSEEFLRGYQKIFSTYQDICFRERDSYALFQKNRKVRVAPDIVFSYQYPGKIHQGGGAVISVLELKGRKGLDQYREAYLSSLAGLCEELTDKNIPVSLVSFCENEGDRGMVEDIAAMIPEAKKEQVKKVYYTGDNMQQILALFAGADYVVGTRFHAVVLGILFGKTVYPVIYSDKTKHMLEEISFTGNFCSISEIETLSIKELLENDGHRVKNLESVTDEAQKQFKALDDSFGSNKV